MRIFLVILFLVASCTGTEEEAMIEMMEEEGIIAPVDPEPMEPEVVEPMEPEVVEPMEPEVVEPMEPEVVEPMEPEVVEPMEPEVVEPMEPSDLPETPTVDQIDIRNQINEVVRDFPPAVLMMEDLPFTVPGGVYYKIRLHCVNCIE